jgi:hypothetical protein
VTCINTGAGRLEFFFLMIPHSYINLYTTSKTVLSAMSRQIRHLWAMTMAPVDSDTIVSDVWQLVDSAVRDNAGTMQGISIHIVTNNAASSSVG